MKNSGKILCMICAMSLCIVVGIFIGRNSVKGYSTIPLPAVSNTDKAALETETAIGNDYRLNLNTATKVQLMELPGIGEVIAQRIVDYREQNGPFQSTDQLLEVEGIGEKKLIQIESLIKVGEK